jgi:hypothetical protein
LGGAFDGIRAGLDGCGMNTHKLYAADGDASQRHTDQAMRALRHDDGAQALQRQARGSQCLHPTAVLQPELCKHQDGPADFSRILLESTQTSQDGVRGVRPSDSVDCAPYRSTTEQQSCREYTNALQAMPRLLAQHRETPTVAVSGQDAKFALRSWQPGWEADVPRVATNIPQRIDRLRALGNAVVPAVAAKAFTTLFASLSNP